MEAEELGREGSKKRSVWVWCGGAPRGAAGAGGSRQIGREGPRHGSIAPWRGRRRGGGGGRMVWPPALSRPTRRWCWRWRRRWWRRWRWSRAAAARLAGGGADGDVETASRWTGPREPLRPPRTRPPRLSGPTRDQGPPGLSRLPGRPRHQGRQGRPGEESRRLLGLRSSSSYRCVYLGIHQQSGKSIQNFSVFSYLAGEKKKKKKRISLSSSETRCRKRVRTERIG